MFSVLWVRSTLADLAQIRTETTAFEYQPIRETIQEIERRLRASPEEEGESRAAGQRISFVPPLGFTFAGLAEERCVLITHLWSFAKRPST